MRGMWTEATGGRSADGDEPRERFISMFTYDDNTYISIRSFSFFPF